jgi:hypothetical protein
MLSETDILKACRILFGDEVDVSRDFLFYLQPCGARSAYRRLAKATHPDLFLNETPDVLKTRTEQFRNLNEAYELLSTFFVQREQGLILSPSDFRCSPSAASSKPKDSASRSHSSATCNKQGRFYNGKIPTRLCKIGIYLYYRGLIPFRTLIEALVWQRRQRPSIGQLARRWGWLKDADIHEVITSRKHQGLFGEKAVDMGVLTEFQVRTLIYFQGTLHKKLGQYFIEKGFFSPEEMETLVRELHEHNARIVKGN